MSHLSLMYICMYDYGGSRPRDMTNYYYCWFSPENIPFEFQLIILCSCAPSFYGSIYIRMGYSLERPSTFSVSSFEILPYFSHHTALPFVLFMPAVVYYSMGSFQTCSRKCEATVDSFQVCSCWKGCSNNNRVTLRWIVHGPVVGVPRIVLSYARCCTTPYV